MSTPNIAIVLTSNPDQIDYGDFIDDLLKDMTDLYPFEDKDPAIQSDLVYFPVEEN
jgi:hypothetical protein